MKTYILLGFLFAASLSLSACDYPGESMNHKHQGEVDGFQADSDGGYIPPMDCPPVPDGATPLNGSNCGTVQE